MHVISRTREQTTAAEPPLAPDIAPDTDPASRPTRSTSASTRSTAATHRTLPAPVTPARSCARPPAGIASSPGTAPPGRS